MLNPWTEVGAGMLFWLDQVLTWISYGHLFSTLPGEAWIDISRRFLSLRACSVWTFTGKVAVITTVLINLACGMVKLIVVW